MELFNKIRDLVLGKIAIIYITDNSIKAQNGIKSVQYELPKTFQHYNYLNHPEEMAAWLRALLQEEKNGIRRCQFVLEENQAFLQTVRLPDMDRQERQNWLRWEGNQYIPYSPENCTSTIIRWYEEEDSERYLSEKMENEPDGLTSYLIVAIPSDMIQTLIQLSRYLKSKLEAVTIMGSDGKALPLNLLPEVPLKERSISWAYQSLTVLCILLSIGFSVYCGIQWKLQEMEWQNIRRQLVPLLSVKKAYLEYKEAEHKINVYRRKLQVAEKNWSRLHPLFLIISETIPHNCWLEEIRQVESESGQWELSGCAETVEPMLKFVENLTHSAAVSDVRVTESGKRQIQVNGGLEEKKEVVSFVLKAQVPPKLKEGM